MTQALLSEIALLHDSGIRVTVLTPGPEDLAVMGGNLMDYHRREAGLRDLAAHIRRGVPRELAELLAAGGSLPAEYAERRSAPRPALPPARVRLLTLAAAAGASALAAAAVIRRWRR
jgi:hypothetical protein